MPSNNPKQISPEEVVMLARKTNLVGRFKIHLSQTANHPDQHRLDEDWVQQLTEKIGNKETLNRALHPIGVILQDNQHADELMQIASGAGTTVPDLPASVCVHVFAGQHRLAMLPRLGWDGEQDHWWHGDVYLKRLEEENPAEFLTMMHESNVPETKKYSQDVDLFRATLKLRTMMDDGRIGRDTFLSSRRALLGQNETLNRAIASLTRNQLLADAILHALTRPHIEKVFHAGGWKRLCTGRLYGVAAGLVHEMVAQVDQLTKGATDVPSDVLTLQARSCLVEVLQGQLEKARRKTHPWDVLPGKASGALKRARQRPASFVTTLNPKTADPWSLPHMVLLPSALGSYYVENELKAMQAVIQHVLKMVADPDHFAQYLSSNAETIEVQSDHPAGMIAHVLQTLHQGQPQVVGYEDKIMLQVWLKRTLLQSELEEHKIPDVKESGDEDYQRLLKLSKPWWNVAKLFKTRRLPFGSRLSVPKEFSMPAEQPQSSQDTVEQTQFDSLSGQPTGAKRQRGSLRDGDVCPKRARLAGAGVEEMGMNEGEQDELVEGEPSQMQDSAGREEEQGSDSEGQGGNVAAGQDVGSPQPRKGLHEVAMEEVRLAEGAGEDNSGFLLGEGEVELSDDEAIEEDESGPIPARVGGDRRLARAMEQMQEAAEHMTPGESRNLTGLIQQILESRRRGEYDLMIDSLNKRAKRILHKIEQREAAQYESRAQQPDNTEELDSQGSAGEDIAQGDESVAESEGAEV